HLALIRARVVAGDRGLAEQTARAIDDALAAPHDADKVRDDGRDMRRRVAEAHRSAAESPYQVKYGPGRLMDLEMVLQVGALITGLTGRQGSREQIAALAETGWLSAGQAASAERARRLYAAVQQAARLTVGGVFNPDHAGPGACELMCRTAGA